MDSQDNNQHPEGCKCNKCSWQKSGDKMCCHGCCGRGFAYHCARWALAVIIVVIVFCIGIKVGEVKVLLENGYGFQSHHYRMEYAQPMMYDEGSYGMMGGGYNASAAQ